MLPMEMSTTTITTTPTTTPTTTTTTTTTALLPSTLRATHFWDCNGGSCDAAVLDPWDVSRYSYAAQYAPTAPSDHGGALYGEKLWLTGAASDALSAMLGNNDSCCGSDDVGGCGQCLLVSNPSAVNSDWTAVVMKKNRCPPHSHGCQLPNLHLDIAVPGYDNLQYSTANVCGNPARLQTFVTKLESSICGSWYFKGVSTAVACSCADMPDASAEQLTLRRGCELFTAWGWRSGDPVLEFRPVPCPAAFRALISGAFNASGAVMISRPPVPDPIPGPIPGPVPAVFLPIWALWLMIVGVCLLLATAGAAVFVFRRRLFRPMPPLN
ncbi:unnamed protein product [Polarella glacialis]|uniref:Cellulase n=1 Tax=Polarella glacialis TaxID=89957 RepID=A0A813FBL8_POLGL|nr:unnamed protein product [Polarella glacialis]